MPSLSHHSIIIPKPSPSLIPLSHSRAPCHKDATRPSPPPKPDPHIINTHTNEVVLPDRAVITFPKTPLLPKLRHRRSRKRPSLEIRNSKSRYPASPANPKAMYPLRGALSTDSCLQRAVNPIKHRAIISFSFASPTRLIGVT